MHNVLISIGITARRAERKSPNPEEKYLKLTPQFLWVDVDIPAVVEVSSNTDWNVL